MRVGAVILAGGESRRMGRDKGWVLFDGQPLIAHALRTLRDAGIREVFISGRAGVDYSSLGCPVLLDRVPGCGPLGGIEGALDMAADPLVFVLAVDLPRITPPLVRRLVAGCTEATGRIPVLPGGLEPLAAIYPRRCADIARQQLLNGDGSARRFAAACIRMGAAATHPVGDAEARCFDNWNSPADVEAPPAPWMNPRAPNRSEPGPVLTPVNEMARHPARF